jgi:hypothetical protein
VVMRITSHLLGLKCICQSRSQSCKLLRSSWRDVVSSLVLMCRYRRQSSANNLAVLFTLLGRSLMYIKNSSGPRTVPWGTPEVTSTAFLRRNLSSCPANIRTKCYTTFVRPQLEYASSVWAPHTQSNINKLESVQRRAARFATATTTQPAVLQQCWTTWIGTHSSNAVWEPMRLWCTEWLTDP